MKLRWSQFSRANRVGIVACFLAVAAGTWLVAGGAIAASLGGAPAVVTSSDVSLEKGLLGWWKLNGNAKDSSPYRRAGTVTTATLTADRKGVSGSAYAFNGGAQIGVPNETGLVAGLPAMSLSGWVKPSNNPTAFEHYFGFRNFSNADFYVLQLQNTNTLECRITTSSGTSYTINSLTVTPNVWQLITVTYDGSALKCSVNAGAQASLAASGTITNATVPMDFGRTNGGFDFHGSLDDVRLYNRALSLNEISSLYGQYNPGIQAGTGENGLQYWWKLDGDAKDSSPNRNKGTVTGATLTADRKGAANSAYSFNGSSNFISAAATVSNPQVFTISAWFKTTSTATNSAIIGLGNDTTFNYDRRLSIDNTGKLIFYLFPGFTKTITSPLSYNDGNWHLATATLSSAGASLYADGALVANDASSVSAQTYNGNWRIGNDSPFTPRFFAGAIDDVRVYNRALSTAEIFALYGNYNSQIQLSDLSKNLIGDWPFNGNAKDFTPYRNTATVTAATLATDRKGRASSSYIFNGSTSKILVPYTATLAPSGTISVGAWFKPTALTNGIEQKIVSKTQNGGYSLQLTGGVSDVCLPNKVGFVIFLSGLNSFGGACADYSLITNNAWNYMLGTYDGTNIKLYVNGTFVNSNARTGSIVYASNNPLCIGVEANASTCTLNNPFTGSIDDVRVWNRALTSTEAAQLFSTYR